MTEEIFLENFWLSTSKPTQIITEEEIEKKHKVKTDEDAKDIKQFYNSLGKPIIHTKKSFYMVLRNKKYKVYVNDGCKVYIKYKKLLEEEIYLNLKEKYRDSFKIIFEDE